MTNSFYSHSDGVPIAQSRGATSAIRAEFDLVQAGFDKLPAAQNLYAGGANFAVDTGTVNALAAMLNPAVLAYFDGMEFTVKAAFANTGPATLSINGLVSKPITRVDGTPLIANDILAGQIAVLRYNATTGTFQYSQTSAAQIAAAQASANSAATSASTAVTNAGAAFTSATNAANSATSAASSAAAAAASAASIAYPISVANGGTGSTTAAAALTALGAAAAAGGTLNNPTLTGAVTVPTVATSDNSTAAASTAYVRNVVTAGSLAYTPVEQGGGPNQTAGTKVNLGKDATTNKLRYALATVDYGVLATEAFVTGSYAPLASPTFTGTVTGSFSGSLNGNATTATSATTANTATTAGNVTGTVAIGNGGTGATTATAALTALGAAALAGAAFTGSVSTTGTLTAAAVLAQGAGTAATVNSTDNTYAKLAWKDNGTTRGYVGANASYCFAAINAANNLAGFTVDNSGNCAAAGAISATTSGTTATITATDTGSGSGANIRLVGNGATTPNKTIRASSGTFQIINSAYSAIPMSMDDAGNVTFSGNVTAFSDERVKTNWRDVPVNFITKLAKVKSGIYDRTDVDKTQIGVSAQSLRKLMPHAVESTKNSFTKKQELSVAYGNAALVAAIELAKKVVELEARLKALEAK